jgi:Domain of unknown function (DUF4124)
MMLLTVCFLFAATSHADAASLYKWTDKEGKVHYGEKPAEDAVNTEQKKFAAPPVAGDDELPYGAQGQTGFSGDIVCRGKLHSTLRSGALIAE